MTKRVFIIDDEADIIEILKDRLEAYGYEVETAQNGQEGLERIAENRPGCVLLDIQMPDMDGIEVLRRVKSSHPGLPVLMITASSTKSIAEECTEKGADGFILKPFDAELLRVSLERAFAKQES